MKRSDRMLGCMLLQALLLEIGGRSHPERINLPSSARTDSQNDAGPFVFTSMRLRGGGRKGRPKATPEERAAVDAITLTPEQEKDLRRHWKKKPEWITVKQGGIEKKIRTKSILNVFKDRALEMKKAMAALPFRLVDLGLRGLHWFRETPQLLKQLAAEPPKPKCELLAEELEAIKQVEAIVRAEDGYAIAREVRPKLMEAAAVNTKRGDEDRMQLEGGDERQALTTGNEVDAGMVVGVGTADAVLGSSTYGEVSLEGFAEALRLAAPQPHERFLDLGSGTGKAVLLAAGLYALRAARGVECIAPLHAASLRLLPAFRQALPSLPPYAANKHPLPEIEFVLGDAMAEPLAGVEVLFAACTCWADQDLQRLSRSCRAMPAGARVILMSRPLDFAKKEWKLVASKLLRYGRGKMTFNVYKKLT